MKKVLLVSLLVNCAFLILVISLIQKRGGVEYIKHKINPPPVNAKAFENVYYKTRNSVFEVMPIDSQAIVFLGNSIISNCDWAELFANPRIKNRGIGGDILPGLIDRIDEILEARPAMIFVMAGANDLELKFSVSQILSDYKKLIDLIRKGSPGTKLIVQSVLPTYKDQNRSNDDIQKINSGLLVLSNEYDCTYIDLFSLFKNENNELDSVYSYDGLHLNGTGYVVWKKELERLGFFK